MQGCFFSSSSMARSFKFQSHEYSVGSLTLADFTWNQIWEEDLQKESM